LTAGQNLIHVPEEKKCRGTMEGLTVPRRMKSYELVNAVYLIA